MSSNWQILQRDLAIFESMVADFEPYLSSEATHWTLAEPDMPGLTIGGLLMRRQRLGALQDSMPPEAQERYRSADARLRSMLQSNVVRFEVRTHQELHARVSEWVNYLRRLQRSGHIAPDYYERVADTRVVIAAMMRQLHEAPYQLDLNVEQEVEILDRNLQRRWVKGGFIWDEAWQAAYPQSEFWYLYGSPR